MGKNPCQSLKYPFFILSLWILFISCNRKNILNAKEDSDKITFICKGNILVFEVSSILTEMDVSTARCICEEQKSVRNSGQIISILENTDDSFFRGKLAGRCDSFVGDRIFKLLLSKADTQECFDGSGGHGVYFPYSSQYIRSIRKMINSIDGLTYAEFTHRLGETASKEFEDAFFDPANDICKSNGIRNQYILDSLYKYYSEGKVILR
jgi:hypothetical protein